VKAVSIFNHVLGPVMRGPSSSHTAGGFHLGRMARSLVGGTPRRAALAFDPGGSYARTFDVQGGDRAFAMGLMGRALTDESFFTALTDAPADGLDLAFAVRPLERPGHPNTVEMLLEGPDGQRLSLTARSIGGGEVEITWLDGWPVLFNGTAFEVLVEAPADRADAVALALSSDQALLGQPRVLRRDDGDRAAVVARRLTALDAALRARVAAIAPNVVVLESAPVYFVQTGETLFSSAADIVRLARERQVSLGRLALEYESILLGLPEAAILDEMLRRWDVMEASVRRGLEPGFGGMQLLAPTAGAIFRAEADGRLSARGLHTKAAARSMAVMHVDAAMGVVCAAPTGGSAGTIPGAMVTLAEERGLSREQVALSMLAAGAIGVVVAQRATFAAEVAGCQVEIGASGAMAAAAIIDAVGGSAADACHAAAIGFQNTMGLVCDPVQGMVEIPCHTRNAVAASSAFVVADLVLGGYVNPIPLDETIDAVYAVGRAMSADLLCTARGGLAVTPSALALRGGCCGKGCADC
jgi:L-serine dehydratase